MNKKEYGMKKKKDAEDRATFPVLGIHGGMEKGKEWWEYFKDHINKE